MKGLIFDMDGVLVHNMQYHEDAFLEFGRRHGHTLSKEWFRANVTGSTNEKIMPKIFGEHISMAEINKYSAEKEAVYRELYTPYLKPVAGLIEYLESQLMCGNKMAIASNAPRENIDFIIKKLQLTKYISHALNGENVLHAKPAPDMFLKCAKLMNIAPENCIVFEDAQGGIRAAKAAGMKAVALTTTHTRYELTDADMYINDFTEYK